MLLLLAAVGGVLAAATVSVGAQSDLGVDGDPSGANPTTTVVEPTTTTVPIPAFCSNSIFKSSSITFNAFLSSGQEVPFTESTAVGEVDLSMDVEDSCETLHWTVRIAGLTEAFAGHLHVALPGQNGPVVLPLFGEIQASGLLIEASGAVSNADLVGAFADSDLGALATAIANGEIYINVHTRDYPDGEIRGAVLVWTVSPASVLAG
jgi:hypothetical protein